MAGKGRKTGRRSVALGLAMMALGVLPVSVGCGAFFQCEGKTDCGTSSSGDTGDVVYVSNSASTNLYAYYITSSGALTAVSGSPYSLSYAPYSMALTPDNSILYLSDGDGIVLYDASTSTGALSNAARQSVETVPEASMVVTPDSKWLLTVDTNTGTTEPFVRIYTVGSGGTLGTPATAVGFGITSGQTITSHQISISPDGTYIAVSLGAAGTLIAPFNTSTGVFGAYYVVGGTSATEGNNAAVFDNSDNVYIAESGTVGTGIVVYAASTDMPVTSTAGTTTVPFITGTGPQGLTFGNSYSYLYTANFGDGTISADTVSSGVLTSIASAITGPSEVQQIVRDTTGKYILAAGISATSGLQLFTIGTSGALTAGATATAGSANGTPVLVATH
jgi:6-phosphogluconolactonase